MTFNEHSAEVLEAVRQLYHQAVSGSISAALVAAMQYGYRLREAEEEHHDDTAPR